MFAYTDKIGKQYIQVGAHDDIITILSTDGETNNVITLALQALSSLITSGIQMLFMLLMNMDKLIICESQVLIYTSLKLPATIVNKSCIP